MTITRTTFALAVGATLWLGFSHGVAASDELNRAKEAYRSASYDEALSTLDGIPVAAGGAEAIEVYEYRVLCLVALDRKEDAKKAIATLITASPSYQMSELDASPRVRTMFTEVRRTLLPSLVQRAYAEAKATFDRKDPQAVSQFDRVLVLLNDPDVAGNAALADLATVAAGFRDLSNALTTAAPAAAATAAAAQPPRTTEPPAPPVLVNPVVISQAVPIPQIREEREWNGEVAVTISEQGRVLAARMTIPIHPVYDQQLVKAAMNWTYKPALRNGVPTQFIKQITIHVDTRPVCSERVTNSCRPPSTDR